MCKREELYKHARRLSYTCIFSKSVDEAVANLSRILLAGDNGFDEGSSFWAQLIDDILSDGCDQEELNWFWRYKRRFCSTLFPSNPLSLGK